MSSFLGLDFSQNLSYYAVPAAFMTALIPHMGAIIAAPNVYDVNNPRSFRDDLAKTDKMDAVTKKRVDRALCAAQNGFDNIGLYAASVVAANVAGLEPRMLNQLAFGYVAIRVIYDIGYIFLQDDSRFFWVRSVCWQSGVAVSLAMWVQAGLGMSRKI